MQVSPTRPPAATPPAPGKPAPSTGKATAKATPVDPPSETTGGQPRQEVGKASSASSRMHPTLAPFAKHFSAMDRLRDTPFEKISPPKGRSKGNLSFKRDQNGDLVFSLEGLLNHTASRRGETFTLSPKTISELRLIFQIDPNEAFMFEFDAAGRLTVPKAFWEPFARISRKAVSVSRVVRKVPDGLQVRDLLALTIPTIAKQIER
ncbi:MAG: hypothetical protein HQL56_18400 [Magnetococcales bacterium]|nr:hypothetical protein [Magnetococcales bacterium]